MPTSAQSAVFSHLGAQKRIPRYGPRWVWDPSVCALVSSVVAIDNGKRAWRLHAASARLEQALTSNRWEADVPRSASFLGRGNK